MKRNLRKYLSGMLSALLFVACILTPVNAHASSGLAVSAGKNFGDGVDTRQDAIDASTAYGNAGYSTVTLQSPTKSDFTSENLSADILFLCSKKAVPISPKNPRRIFPRRLWCWR